MTELNPTSEAEIAEAVAVAADRARPLAIAGSGTKAGIGRPAQTEATLSVAGLAGITLYEPAELVVAAKAGTPLSQIAETLAQRGQNLPFEPLDYRTLLGSHGEPTIGGVAAGNLSGPRRIVAGGARDSLIGIRFVNGRGEAIKSGGRVMKNVTGLDLVKLMAGSWGTLAVITEVTFKVLPRPERAATLLFRGLDDARAVAALTRALASPYEVTGAAHLPGGDAAGGRTLIRIEGFSFSVDYRLAELRRLLKACGGPDVIEGRGHEALWLSVRDATLLAEPRDRAIWRLSTAPNRAPAVMATIARTIEARWFYDWGGGLVWLATDPAGDAGAGAIRAALHPAGGHATLVRAPAEVRAAVDVFESQPEPLMRLTAGLKSAFDPAGILNPGRMYAGL